MNEIKKLAPIYLEKFDIYVNPYLSVNQIQQIVNAIIKFDMWSEREQNKMILTLYHATNMSKEDIEKYDYEIFEQSGLISEVVKNICNFDKIEEALNYHQSTARGVYQILNKVAPLMDELNNKFQMKKKKS